MKSNEIIKNGGRGMLEKVISSFIAATVVISYSASLIGSSLDNSYFKFDRNSNGYNVSLNSEADFANTSKVEFPSTYNDGNSVAEVTFTSAGISNNTITSITIPTATPGNASAFSGLSALEEVNYTNDGVLPFTARTFQSCSSTLKTIRINATSVTFNVAKTGGSAFINFINNAESKIYVVSDEVKQQIISGTANGSAPVTGDKIEVVESNLPKPTIKVTCDDIKYGDAKFNPSVEVTYVDAEEKTITVEEPTVTYGLFTDEDCTQSASGSDPIVNASEILPGTYYLKATLEGTADYQGGSKVIPVKVTEWADKSNLNKALESAYKTLYTDDDHQVEADLSEYVPKAVQNLKNAVQSATMYNFRNTDPDVSGYDAENSNSKQSTLADPKACQAEVDYVTKVINTALEGLVKKADFDDSVKAKMQARYNKYVNVTETNYTSDSFEAFKTTRDEFNESYGKMGSGTLTNENALAVIEKIDEAYKNLKYKNPPTFDDLKAAIEKAEPYLEEVEKYTEDTLQALDNAITSGKSMLDYADKGALETDKVVETDLEDVEGGFTFDVPKVKQSDVNTAASAVNRCVSSLVTKEQRAAYLDLQEKVSDVAENYSDPDLFTTSSYAALTEALTAANNVKETDDVEDIKSAAEALQKAIDGLKHVEGYLPAGDPIKYIKYGYNADPLISGVYDGKSAATQVRLTFDCAPDVNFGPYASLELEAQVDGKQIGYAKLTGKNATSENGAKNAKAVLKLGTPLEVGNNYLLNAYTYSWQGKEYAYAVTKIEFLDDEGNILKAFNDITAAKENLKQSVEAAKKLAEDEYTAESYSKLEEAIAKAEEVIANENVTKNEVDAAAAALEEAIRGLREKQQPTSQNPSNSSTVKPAPNKRSNADVQKDKQAAVNKMKTAKIKKLTVKSKTKKKITVTWKKVKKAKGYQVQVSTSKKFKKSKIIFRKFTKKKTLKISSKKIKSKKTYYVRVRAYTTYNDINGKPQKVYSKWNKKLRTVKVK